MNISNVSGLSQPELLIADEPTTALDVKRIHFCVFHLDIKNNKVWIQENTTEFDLANELVEMGIPKQDIVIGFNTPKMRGMTDFAIG